MSFKKVRALPGATAACAGLLLSLSACVTTDTFGPTGPFDNTGALQSLVLGIGPTGASDIFGPPVTSLGSLASHLDQVNVTINGVAQTMFALGLQENYPAGTCVETLIVTTSPPGTCTPLPYSLGVILWQSHAANATPDRLAFMIGNPGTNDFLNPGTGVSYPLGVYFELGNDIWDSQSGTLTSNMAATTETCAVPIPRYATAGSCSFATFDVQGTINLVPRSSTTPVTIVIPRQTFHGMLQTITAVQAIN
jgi:hypothetical protein